MSGLDFIDSIIQKPTTTKMAKAWIYNNDTIASCIMKSISKEIVRSIVYTGSVKEVWDELSNRFKESNGPKVYQLWKSWLWLLKVIVQLKHILLNWRL